MKKFFANECYLLSYKFFSETGHVLTYQDLFDIWKNTTTEKRESRIYQHILAVLDSDNTLEDAVKKKILNSVHWTCLEFKKKWKLCARSLPQFKKRYGTWLLQTFKVSNLKEQEIVQHVELQPGPSGLHLQRGRPKKLFDECSLKVKKRKVKDLVTTRSPSELSLAAALSTGSSLNPSGKSLNVEQALGLYLDLGLSYRKYGILKSVINNIHPETIPSYHKLIEVRNAILPQGITITETSAEVNLQELLDKTCYSILKYLKNNNSDIPENSDLLLICKWGFDGSSGHSTYKQKFSNVAATDEFIFLTALVPVQLIEQKTKRVLWKNPTASSTFYCRPMKFVFTKESPEVVNQEHEKFQEIIANLTTSALSLDEKVINVSFKMVFTMIDGSICNVVSGTRSSQTCYICGAKPSDMNKTGIENRTPDISQYKYGLSTLHAWIRSFECVLHIAYRLPFKTWQVRSADHKSILKERKENIQKAFKEQLGLIVDKPKPGFGSTNDGNTAKRFFKNFSISSAITGINENLIKNLGIILNVMSSGEEINVDRFSLLLNDTKDLYLANYSWYYLPVSLHKIFIHGPAVISSLIMPIGMLSEDALEGRHKDIRYIREHSTRKTSRNHTNKDLMVMLLLSSDPYLAIFRNKRRKGRELDEETLKYLIIDDNNLTINIESGESAEETTSDSE